MSIYHYYPSRKALLDAMVEEWMDLAVPPDLLDLVLPRDWRGRMRSMALAVRRAALSHPQTFPLVVDHGTAEPIYRPPLRRASWYEQILLDLAAGGLCVVDAAVVCHRFADFLLGYLLSEAAQASTIADPAGMAVARSLREVPLERALCSPRPLQDPTWAVSLSRRQTDADFTSALEGFLHWPAGLEVPADPQAPAS